MVDIKKTKVFPHYLSNIKLSSSKYKNKWAIHQTISCGRKCPFFTLRLIAIICNCRIIWIKYVNLSHRTKHTTHLVSKTCNFFATLGIVCNPLFKGSHIISHGYNRSNCMQILNTFSVKRGYEVALDEPRSIFRLKSPIVIIRRKVQFISF